MWEVDFFSLPSGRCPVAEFLSTLDEKTDMPYIDHSISSLEQYGHQLRMPHAKPLRDKIFELRIQTINGKIRLLYFFFDKNKIIITNGLKKKKGPVGNHHIDLAIKYHKLYLESIK